MAVVFIKAEARLRSSLSPASLRRPFGHPVLTNMPAASRSASLASQLLRLHAAAPTPHMAELWPSSWSLPSLDPATIDPASTTTRCARVRASSLCPSLAQPPSVAQPRRTSAAFRVAAGRTPVASDVALSLALMTLLN